MKPNVTKDITGNVKAEKTLTNRLDEMDGQPSESIFVRGIKEIVQIADD